MASCDPWTEDEMIAILESKALLSGNETRNKALFAVQVATGARISEVLSLARKDVIDGAGTIRRRIAFTNTKNGLTRNVDLVNPFPLPFLKKWLLELEEMGYAHARNRIFVNTTGTPLTRWRWGQIIRNACDECYLSGHYGTHSARKTWARDTYRHYHERRMKGELIDPLVKLQEAGGWKTIEAARRYIAFMLGDTIQAQESLYPSLQSRYKEQ